MTWRQCTTAWSLGAATFIRNEKALGWWFIFLLFSPVQLGRIEGGWTNGTHTTTSCV